MTIQTQKQWQLRVVWARLGPPLRDLVFAARIYWGKRGRLFITSHSNAASLISLGTGSI
jgi:Na+-translocating ferredoxin:NAD+ oxidoreductase RnfC subunit